MTNDLTLEGVRKRYTREQRGPGCPVCGKKNACAVAVHLNELGTDGRMLPKRVTSKMRSFCEQHGVELFEKLLSELKSEGIEK